MNINEAYVFCTLQENTVLVIAKLFKTTASKKGIHCENLHSFRDLFYRIGLHGRIHGLKQCDEPV